MTGICKRGSVGFWALGARHFCFKHTKKKKGCRVTAHKTLLFLTTFFLQVVRLLFALFFPTSSCLYTREAYCIKEKSGGLIQGNFSQECNVVRQDGKFRRLTIQLYRSIRCINITYSFSHTASHKFIKRVWSSISSDKIAPITAYALFFGTSSSFILCYHYFD